MTQHRILIRRIVSEDGRAVAEAKSVVSNLDGNTSTTHQTVTVTVASDGSRSSSSASSSSSSSAARIQTSNEV